MTAGSGAEARPTQTLFFITLGGQQAHGHSLRSRLGNPLQTRTFVTEPPRPKGAVRAGKEELSRGAVAANLRSLGSPKGGGELSLCFQPIFQLVAMLASTLQEQIVGPLRNLLPLFVGPGIR